ncbi:MAG: hypothetical protein IJB33_05345 [Akkermansia sp.]|nr:hypothetical protein [Akkermansia sp.]
MGSNFSDSTRRRIVGLATTLFAAGSVCTAEAQNIVPLPSEIFGEGAPGSNPVIDLADRMISVSGQPLAAELPETMTIENVGGEVLYDNEKHTLTYRGKGSPVKLLTDAGLDVNAREICVNLKEKKAVLTGPLTVYQGESLTRAGKGEYDWSREKLDVYDVRSKVTGILVKGTRVEYAKDEEGKNFLKIHDAYVAADDSKVPDTWVGAGELTVYPGDYGRVTRLSLASGEYDIPIPVLGWFSFSHSLNPREGYMPNLGTKSSWGAYLCNSYGILLGNRRVENNMPVTDYLLTTRLDYRTRRGLAGGLDFESEAMRKRYPQAKGLELYYIQDSDPMINPTKTKRLHTDHERYRVAFSALWDLPRPEGDTRAEWTVGTNINILSDRYVLRDFFEELSQVNNEPDNTIRLVRRDKNSQTMLMTRLAPNDYYITDQRAELSYYRVRSAIGGTGITYETRNSAGIMKQEVPFEERFSYKAALDDIKDDREREYYARLLNTQPYFRINSTHEFARHFNVLKFLNITPKAGAGYTGYYGVEGVGADNRFLGYVGLDANIKIHRHFDSFRVPYLGYKGLTHIMMPYTTLSHCNISSANPGVPKLDAWDKNFGTTSSNPMELDLMGFTGLDSWGTWSLWRFGLNNRFITEVDMEKHSLLNWNVFIDYNAENPHAPNKFSNLYSMLTFRPSERVRFYLESQTPTISGGDDFTEYRAGVGFQPCASLETSFWYRSIKDHPIQSDSEQLSLRATLRINEKYTVNGRWDFDIERSRIPIQQYSVFRKTGSWFTGASLFLRDNGGKKETGFGISFTLAETGTALPISIL